MASGNGRVERMEGYDVVIAGAGTTACVLAKELALKGKKVVVLDIGDDSRRFLGSTLSTLSTKHKLGTTFSPSRTKEGDTLMLPIGLGGGSKTYAGLSTSPDYDWWRSWGVDLEPYREWAEKESWVSPVPPEFMSEGELYFAEAADKAGFPMSVSRKHIKFDRCKPKGCQSCSFGCPNEARWDATYAGWDAMKLGAKFVWKVRVEEPILESGKAVGFRGKKEDGSVVEARGKVAVGCAGGYGNVAIARKAGLKDAGTTFAGDASIITWGLVPKGQKGNLVDHPMVHTMHYEPTRTHFGSCMMTRLGFLGANVMKYGIGMAKYALFDYDRILFAYAKTKDDGEGYVYDDGSMSKTYTERDRHQLEFAKETNRKILLAGKCDPNKIFDYIIMLAHPSATVPIGTCVDTHLEAKGVPNLYFCDSSVFPESIGSPTVLTLVHLAKYEAEYLATVV
jgi:choline dehydrogenase-like flavoprotein